MMDLLGCSLHLYLGVHHSWGGSDHGGGAVGVVGDRIDVQLQGVGPCLLYQRGKVDPPAAGVAVEAGDNGDVQQALGLGDVFEVALRAEVVVAHVGQVPLGLGVRLA